MSELTTAKLLQMCLYHADKAAGRSDFYKVKSQATYRQQAAANCQEWAEFYAAMAEVLEKHLELERAGLTTLTLGQQLALQQHNQHPTTIYPHRHEPGHHKQ